MPELMCTRCKTSFKYDANDVRPFIYHNCADGVMMAHKNPNNKPRKRLYVTKKKTHWQNFDSE